MRLHPAELASVALFAFFAIELLLRQGSAARSWKATASDRGSTMLIVVTYIVIGVCLALPFPGPHFPRPVRWGGAVFAVLGVALRVAAFRSLGSSYSRTLRINEGQQLVMRGVHRRIRSACARVLPSHSRRRGNAGCFIRHPLSEIPRGVVAIATVYLLNAVWGHRHSHTRSL
jgi:protein-S-isoprenylcysteine O-methyltransferase Ste14